MISKEVVKPKKARKLKPIKPNKVSFSVLKKSLLARKP